MKYILTKQEVEEVLDGAIFWLDGPRLSETQTQIELAEVREGGRYGWRALFVGRYL